MTNSKSFKEMLDSAKRRYSDNKQILELLKEMEQELPLESQVKGTIITLNHMEDR